jgi:hypothetical protein
MFGNIIKIALLCVVIGCASIPVSFTITDSFWEVWIGNALGSLFSAVMVIFIGNRITDTKFKKKMSRRRAGKKVVKAFDEGQTNKGVIKTKQLIDNHGLKLFSFFCPIFPGVLVSTVAVYILDLNRKTYERWMFLGVVFASGFYVFGYWLAFVR